ncbi:hypothetical protein C0Q70_05543 [Pomacea canaliculata]|uniref:Sulfotransferase domain-containing protein n=1 Tax=Pomacea canaliculata TaxID=400727 RepID=A0A2T7PLJ8_POMCA|nr:hypothetical protein C0Q70_05543 [Pomacea canaliculata]
MVKTEAFGRGIDGQFMGQMGVCKTGKAGNLHPRAEWEQLADGCNSQTVFWLHRELHCTAKSTTGLQEQAAPDKHRVPEVSSLFFCPLVQIHKSGSTTVANILARYALTHDLNVALPNKPINAIRSNYFEAGSFREDQVQPIAVGQQYHVLFNHMIFNSTALKHLMPPDTFYLTIMREPTKRFESAVHYYNILSLPKVVETLNSLIKKQMFADILGKPSALAHNGLDTFDAKCNETDKINNPIRCLTSTKPSPGKNYTKGEDIFTGKTSLPSHLQKLEDTKNSGNKFDKSLLRVLATRLLDLPMSGTSSGPHTKIALRPRVSAEFVSKAEDDTSSARSKTDPRVMQMLQQLMNDAARSLRQQQQHNNGSLSALLRKDIRESLQVPEIYNSIAFNSGLPLNRQKDEKAVTEHIAKLDHEFHLVMIMERFDESLILLKRKACLELRDIVYFKLNAVVKGRGHRLTDDDRKVLRGWQMADHVIYEFFLIKFQSEVEAMGEDFGREVLHFQGILKRLRNFCDTLAKFVDVLVVKASVWNEEFTLGARDCDMMKLDEMIFQAMLSVRAAQRLDLATTSSSLNKVT